MSKYFSSQQVSTSFKRLSSRKSDGKTHLERTSVLMYFLAFDAVCKKNGTQVLDLDPHKVEGKSNRKAVELEFTKLVLLHRSHGTIRQVCKLGEVASNGTDPEKRISSNFLTVPLKKASDHSEPYFYPKRPRAPLFKMGLAATHMKWGLEYHDEWAENLPIFMSEIKDSTQFTDLAIFILRDSPISPNAGTDYLSALTTLVKERFSNRLATFLIARIEKEKIFAKHIVDPFTDSYEPFAKMSKGASAGRFEKLERKDLLSYINYLEQTLQANDIHFEYNKKK
jgi:hypothetical protein